MAHGASLEDLKERIAANVRQRREERGLTQESLAAVARLHGRHLQRIESGAANVTLESLVRLAEALDVDPTDLLEKPVEVARGALAAAPEKDRGRGARRGRGAKRRRPP